MKAAAQRLLIAVLLLCPPALLAQTVGKISGRVVDENGQALVGVNVVVEGTKMGASTDLNGTYFILNVPPATYSMRAGAIGFQAQRVTNIKVMEGLTTKVDFTLHSTAIEGPDMTVTHTRPAVQKDLTSKTQGFDAEELNKMPIRGSLQSVLTKQAGISADIVTVPISSQPVFGQFATIPNDGMHFRGGRTNETLYLFDGITVNDGLWGGFNLDAFGEYSLTSLRTLTGTFGPQYGEAMSGVVEMQTMDNLSQTYSGKITSFTDKFGKSSGEQNSKSGEVFFSGPVAGMKTLSFQFSGRVYSTDGNILGYIYPDYIDSRGQDKSGAPKTVPMAYQDQQLLLGKLVWQPYEWTKLRFGMFEAKNNHGVYNHYFKYNPYGTPHVHLGDQLVYAKWTQLLSQSTFFDVTVSQYTRTFKSHMYDNPANYLLIPTTGTAEFSISGTDYAAFDSKFRRWEASVNFSSQVTKEHYVSAGATVDKMETKLLRYNPQGNTHLEDYDYFPLKIGSYVNDKMEFEDIGLILNLGLRFDYVDPNRDFVIDITKPDGAVGKVPARNYFSPRLGISYPIGDEAALRFGYGHYYQYPDFFKAFQGTNQQYSLYPAPNVKEVLGAIAKGDIQEEHTVNYEVGLQLKLSPVFSVDVTGFYRKISNLIGIVMVDGYLTSGSVIKAQRFPSFDNVAFATVKGIEVSVVKRVDKNFSGFFNYTYSQALVSSSVLFSLPTDISQTYPADWDQTHAASCGLSFDFDDKWGFSILGSISSGTPYTYMQFRPNAERAPFISSFDGLVYKEFSAYGVTSKIFLQVLNILNRRNVWWVYSDSGQPGVDTNPATSDDYTNNPAMWGPGRRFQAGISFSF